MGYKGLSHGRSTNMLVGSEVCEGARGRLRYSLRGDLLIRTDSETLLLLVASLLLVVTVGPRPPVGRVLFLLCFLFRRFFASQLQVFVALHNNKTYLRLQIVGVGWGGWGGPRQ